MKHEIKDALREAADRLSTPLRDRFELLLSTLVGRVDDAILDTAQEHPRPLGERIDAIHRLVDLRNHWVTRAVDDGIWTGTYTDDLSAPTRLVVTALLEQQPRRFRTAVAELLDASASASTNTQRAEALGELYRLLDDEAKRRAASKERGLLPDQVPLAPQLDEPSRARAAALAEQVIRHFEMVRKAVLMDEAGPTYREVASQIEGVFQQSDALVDALAEAFRHGLVTNDFVRRIGRAAWALKRAEPEGPLTVNDLDQVSRHERNGWSGNPLRGATPRRASRIGPLARPPAHPSFVRPAPLPMKGHDPGALARPVSHSEATLPSTSLFDEEEELTLEPDEDDGDEHTLPSWVRT